MATTGSTSSDQHTRTGADHPYVRYVKEAMAREDLGLNAAAAKCGISKTTLSFILRGDQIPRTITNAIHEAIAIGLNLPMFRLVELAGYNMWGGVDIPYFETIAQVHEVKFPPIRSLADIAKLDREHLSLLFAILRRQYENQQSL